MTEGKEKKKKTAAAAAANAAGAGETPKPAAATPKEDLATRMKDMSSGEMLRAARIERKLGLEEISASIHIRVAQLRAIEEGNIDALPGMTYALGFVRSYANFLKINSAEVVNKFKSEHGAMKPAMPELHIPTPPPENRMPDPMVTGVAAFGAILLVVLWTVFSGGEDDTAAVEKAEAIPPAPVVQLAQGETAAAPALAPETSGESQPVIAPFPGSSPEKTEPAVSQLPLTPAVEAPAAAAATTAPVEGEIQPGPVTTQIAMPVERPDPAAAALAVEASEEQPAEVINVKRVKSRITIRARESSWVQIDDGKRRTIFKRVLKPGEQFAVPDEPGMSLVTSNAGGIDIIVDGRKQPAVGEPGEIVRGVVLEPGRITKRRVRVNNY